jgi:hypothetical protein
MDFFNSELATASNEKPGLHETIQMWRVPRDNRFAQGPNTPLALLFSTVTTKTTAWFISFKNRISTVTFP